MPFGEIVSVGPGSCELSHKNAAPPQLYGQSVNEPSDDPLHISNYWFPWMVIVGGQVPCALAWSLLPSLRRRAEVPARALGPTGTVIGAPLLVRTQRRVELTEAGRVLLDEARRLLKSLVETTQSFSTQADARRLLQELSTG
jgi:hypothetical protein